MVVYGTVTESSLMYISICNSPFLATLSVSSSRHLARGRWQGTNSLAKYHNEEVEWQQHERVYKYGSEKDCHI